MPNYLKQGFDWYKNYIFTILEKVGADKFVLDKLPETKIYPTNWSDSVDYLVKENFPTEAPAGSTVNPNSTTNIVYSPQNIYNQFTNKFEVILSNPNITTKPSSPPQKLPKEEDNQTEFKTPAGKSISIKKSLQERQFGKLLYEPITNQTLKVRESIIKNYEQKIVDENKIAATKLAEGMASALGAGEPEEKPQIWNLSALIAPQYLRGFTGEIGLLYGLKPLAIINEVYTDRSINAYFPIQTHIPVKYEVVNKEEKIDNLFKESDQELTFSSFNKLQLIYQILGGDKFWNKELKFKLEEELLKVSDKLYLNKDEEYELQETTIESLPDYLIKILASTFYKIGLFEFPAEVPKNLIGYDDEAELIKINTLANFFEWYVKQFDALVGEFPITIEIEDADPITKGKQTQKIELPNLAETLAEIYGLSRESATSGDVITNFLIRLSAEIVGIKNLSIVTQDFVKANASFLGYRGNPRSIKIQNNVNLDKPEQIDNILTEKDVSVIGWKIEDKETLMDNIKRLIFAAGIIKAVFFRGGDLKDEIEKFADNFSPEGSEEDKKKWEDFLKMLNDPESDFNKEAFLKPKVKDKWESSSTPPTS